MKAGRGQGEARRRALADDASFRWDMAECRLRMLRGEKDVVFPAGCFLWARRFGFATHAASRRRSFEPLRRGRNPSGTSRERAA
ncbi:MAG: hypothetical protein H6722_31975 [Sandaracinus sp.]|nr:hypothetical protein [Sandaracinus sp.]